MQGGPAILVDKEPCERGIGKGEVVCQLLLRGEKSQMKSELEDENPHSAPRGNNSSCSCSWLLFGFVSW